MPAACRALTSNPEEPPATPAQSVLTAFLQMVVDALVRTAAAPTALTTIPTRKLRRSAPTFDSIHDQWLHALRSTDGVMDSTAGEVGQLAEQIRDWRRPIAVTAAPYRLCFRLEEPAGNGEDETIAVPRGAWHVRYLLRAADDPSLLVPVGDVWNAKGRKAAVLQRGGTDPREYLLSALGQAAGISPQIEESLKSPAPEGYALDAGGAHGFLTEKAWLLEQAGFDVLLPAWWTRKGTKLRLAVRAHVKSPKMQSSGALSLDELVKFDWHVALGDHTLTLEELEMLARLKAPLIKVRGQWVQVTGEEIQAALTFWTSKAAGSASLRVATQLALGAGQLPGGLAFDGVTASGWVEQFLAQLEGRTAFEELPPPADFHGTLRPYQVRGYSWLGFLRQWGLGACLADDMGLGKTVQTLALVQQDWKTRGPRPTLLICPMSVVGNWQKEAERFTPELPVLVHHGGQRIKGPAFRKAAEKHALVLSSYALLHRDFELFNEVKWAGVVLDEAQNIKNPETKQARAARAVPADYRIALTGTPVENHVGDLWSIMEFLNPGLLGTQTEFRRKFFVPIQLNRDPEAGRRLKRLTGPFLLRRLKTDKTIINDLPDKLEMKVFCTLTKEQASLYAAVVADANKTLEKAEEGIQRKGVILATLSKLKQVCNHPAHFLGDNSPLPSRSGKLARLTEMLEETLDIGDRSLVFTQFSEMGTLIKKHLQETFGREVLFLHGGVGKKQRDAMVARFQGEQHGPRVFILSLKAGGTGLNLTAANHVFHFDRWWNPAVENQATDRAFRIGQTRAVQVHKFLCVGTLEEIIDEMIERKQEVAAKVVGTGEGWLTELSNEQLRDLFALRQEALGE
jgi:SNF2 family DNA or RNA helicase